MPSLSQIPNRMRRPQGLVAAGAVVAACGAIALATLATSNGDASATTPQGYAAIVVDTTPLGPDLYRPTGERLRQMVSEEMARKFVVTGDAANPRLVVRLTQVAVSPDVPREPAVGEQLADRMEGETLVVTPDGAVLRRYPVTVSSPASLPQGEDGVAADFRRLGELVKSYASWSARFVATANASM